MVEHWQRLLFYEISIKYKKVKPPWNVLDPLPWILVKNISFFQPLMNIDAVVENLGKG